MKNIKLYILTSFCFVIVAMFGCKDSLDDHYTYKSENKSNLSLFDYIKTQSELSIFAEMLEISGLDTLLTQSQTFTVWAPGNDYLKGIDLNNKELVTKIIKNHICRYSYSSIDAKDKYLRMINNKLIRFNTQGESVYFDNYKIAKPDISTLNGILHVINGYVPYRLNHWEYLMNEVGLDSLRKYLNSQDYLELDYEKSYRDGVFMDSVMIKKNTILESLGKLNLEDSIYTMLVPDNYAWEKARQKILPYFNTLKSDGGDSAKLEYTKWAIVRDLVFRGRFELPFETAEIKSTINNKFTNPNEIFSGAVRNKISNGLAYKTSDFNFKSIESWFKEIRVEAEDNIGGERLASNYSVNTVTGFGTGFNISGNQYISALPKTSSSISKLYLKYPIYNTLSGTYNIYVVFVPTYAIDKTDKRPFKLNYFISYVNSEGKQLNDIKLNVINNVTDTTAISKVLIAEKFKFPYCNIEGYNNIGVRKPSAVQIKIENAAGTSSSETSKFNRTIKVDCIILEPVE